MFSLWFSFKVSPKINMDYDVIVISSDEEDASNVIIISSDTDSDMMEDYSNSNNIATEINIKSRSPENYQINVKKEGKENVCLSSCLSSEKAGIELSYHSNNQPCLEEPLIEEKSEEVSYQEQNHDNMSCSSPLNFNNLWDDCNKTEMLCLNVSPCGKELGVCPRLHQNQGKAYSSCPYFDTVINTMMGDIQLQDYALFNMLRKGVTKNSFLSFDLMKNLMNFLLGSVEKEVLPSMQKIILGYNILMKMLRYHPPCKDQMLNYYKKLCQEFFWDPLISNIEEALILGENTGEKCEENNFVEDTLLSTTDLDDTVSGCAKQEREARQQAFRKLTGKERLKRLTVVFKFFSLLIENNMSVWILKCSIPKFTPFRRDSCCILVPLIWDSNLRGEGQLNAKCVRLVKLLTMANLESELMRYILKMLTSISAVSLVKDRHSKSFFNIGDCSKGFARDLSFQLKAYPSFISILYLLEPLWLRFHVCTFLLNIEEPSSLHAVLLQCYKSKEFELTVSEPLDLLKKWLEIFLFYLLRLSPVENKKAFEEFLVRKSVNHAFNKEPTIRIFSIAIYASCFLNPPKFLGCSESILSAEYNQTVHEVCALLHHLPRDYAHLFSFIPSKLN